MVRKTVVGLSVALMFLAGVALAADKKETKKDKGSKGVAATVVKVDAEKGTLTVTTEGGKTEVLQVGKDAKIVGPRGGVSKAGLEDDRLKPGAKVNVVMEQGGKGVSEIHLGFRKGTKDKKEEKKEIKSGGTKTEEKVKTKTETKKDAK